MKQIKVAGAVILILLAIVLIAQNTESVETKLLFVTVSMPRAVLLLIALLAGVALGLIQAARVRTKPTKREQMETDGQGGRAPS